MKKGLGKEYMEGIREGVALCKEGKKAGVETPVCAQVVEMIHGIENGLYEIDYKNVDFFEI